MKILLARSLLTIRLKTSNAKEVARNDSFSAHALLVDGVLSLQAPDDIPDHKRLRQAGL
jgi:hypothetical protein